ncbi:MAG TPA: hypothetical protein EYO20_10380 [Gemmatimonadetes bacterium]|nr:hypothetical protein [Gemmatimonadota bacterium]
MSRASTLASNHGVARVPWEGWNTISRVLLVLWIALLAVDRIDFLGGEGAFILTPFLVLTPLLLVFEGFRVLESRARIQLQREGRAYLVLLLLFLSIVLISTLLAQDPLMSAKRSALLVFLGMSTFAVAVTVSGRKESKRALVAGAKLGLIVAVVFGVLEVFTFLSNLSEPFRFGFLTVDLWPHTYYGIVPRISGQVMDANRGGLLMVFYLFILLRWDRPGFRRWGWLTLGSVFILLSLSRSAIFTGFITVFLIWSEGRKFRVNRRAVFAVLIGLVVSSGWLMANSSTRSAVVRGIEPLAQRLSPTEASTQEHFLLLGRGVEEGTESVKRATIGMGYGNAYMELQDIFPGNKYGNFHSLYVTMLAESGVFALILSLVLLGYPLGLPGAWRAFIAGVFSFNVFYQTLAEPLFWFALAMAWLTVQQPERQELVDQT